MINLSHFFVLWISASYIQYNLQHGSSSFLVSFLAAITSDMSLEVHMLIKHAYLYQGLLGENHVRLQIMVEKIDFNPCL